MGYREINLDPNLLLSYRSRNACPQPMQPSWRGVQKNGDASVQCFGTDKKKALVEINLGEGHSTSAPWDNKTPTRAGASSTLHLKVEGRDSKLV